MKNRKTVILYSSLFEKDVNVYKYTNFLINGDLVTYKNIEFNEFNRKSIILIYPSNNIKDKKWMCDSIYEFNENVIFGGIANDKLWVLSNKSIFIFDLLDLSVFQHRKITLEICNINFLNFRL